MYKQKGTELKVAVFM